MTTSSYKKKPLKKSNSRSSPWSLFFSTLFYIVSILLFIYIVLGIVLTYMYYSVKIQLQTFSLQNLRLMSEDLNAGYDFQKDDLVVKDANAKLAKDLTDAMLRYYDNNLQTVKTISSSLVLQQTDIVSHASTTLLEGAMDIEGFKSHALGFVKQVSITIKQPILKECNYFVRFFSMLLSVLPLASTDTALEEIKEFLLDLLPSL